MPRPGQLVLLISPKGKRYLRTLDDSDELHTNFGVLPMTEVTAAEFGQTVTTHLGHRFRLVKPTLADLVKGVKRKTQILYPKEIGYVLVKLGVGPGSRVVESGSGSGSMTVALSHAAGPTGRVFTYERRPEFFRLCRKNLERCGLGGNVVQFCRDIADGFEDHRADALFLDVRTPWEYLDHVAATLAPGSPMAFLLPTVSQVSMLLEGLEQGPFADVEVSEILIRNWKAVPDRLRPADRMIAHTGFLIFARHQEREEADLDSLGTRQRKQEAARQKRLAARDEESRD